MQLKVLSLFLFSLLFLTVKVYPQKSDAEVIKYISICEVGSGKMTENDSITIQINNRNGDTFAEIELPYSKLDKISDVDAWIEDMNGAKIRELKKSDIVDRSAISNIALYEDDFKKCFELKHNVYPYRVTYTYRITYKNFLTIAKWSPIIYSSIPTKIAKLKIILPKDYQYNKFEKNITEKCQIDSTGNTIILNWKASFEKQIKSELYSQPDNLRPQVIVAPLYFQYGIDGSTKSWESYGYWQYKLASNLDILPEDEKLTITNLINGITDKREIVKILYHYMQDHTRYINVSIGIGGLKPYSAAYVSKNKYGDCKALTNYMKAILSFVGIESIYTNVYANEQPRTLNKNFSGPQFNHVVLAVPMKNDTIWLENTSNTNPFGYMGAFTQNREALLICKEHSKLTRIPALKKEDNLVSNKLEFDLNSTGFTKVILSTYFRGNDFDSFNQLHSDYNAGDKDRIIREYMPFDNYEVLNWNIKKLNRDSARIELYATVNLNKFLKPLSNEYYFSIYPCKIPSFSPPANRTLPVDLAYPIYNSDTLIYNLPTGYELKSTPDPVSLKTKFGNYKMSSKVSGGKLLVTKSFEIFPGSYPVEQYSDLYSFIQSVKNVDKMKIIIKPIN